MMSTEETKGIIEMIIKEYIPIAENSIEKMAPVLDKISKRIVHWLREQNVESFNFYLKNGFSRAEAMMFIFDAKISLQRYIDSIGKNGK